MLHYLTFSIVFEIQCFFFGLSCLMKDRETAWKILPLYLFLTCLAELTGIYLKRHHHANQWPYNILLVCHLLFTTYIFFHLFSKSKKSKLVVTSGLAFLICLYIYDIIQHGFLWFNKFTYNAMSVFFTLYSLYYFYLLLKEDVYIRLRYSAAFWWVVGVLFFYFGDTAVNIFRGKLAVIKITPNHALPYYILVCLNIILYSCWSYSFICRKWLTKRSEI